MVAGSPACTEVVLAVGTVVVLAAGTATGVEAFDYRRVTMLISNFARGVTLAALLAPSVGFAQSATTSLPSTPATAPTAASPSTIGRVRLVPETGCELTDLGLDPCNSLASNSMLGCGA